MNNHEIIKCYRCGRNNHTAENCYASTSKDGKLLNYCKCLRCRAGK